ncbi:MAG: alkane 1-monooxygenase [Pseudomonadota bacterium]
MIFVAETKDGETVTFKDGKRFLWIISVLSPLITGLSAVALLSGGSIIWALVPVFFYYGAIPLLDLLFGEDTNNPPEEVVEQLSQDNYYRVLLHLTIPLIYFSFLSTAVAVGTVDLPWWCILTLILGAGATGGGAINVSHELGHKLNWVDRLGAKLASAVTGYAHFNIEHNQGHHLMVSTPEDIASSRFNESVYRFAMRELPGAAKRGWNLEARRLKKKGFGTWTWRNELLQGYAITGAIALVLIVLFGWIMIPFLIGHHFAGWMQLTYANYVEHYGLKREKKANGKYVPCEPKHSWNTNHIISNLFLFHLQRHSDHHANPLRPYQSLRNFDELPRLPSGYPGSFVLASIPPLWFSIMNPKVLEWAGGDMSKVNTGP